MPLFGYARVSTRDQDLAAQDAELMAAGCAKVFKEKISGAKTDRPELAKAISRLEPDDVLVVTRLDRLARSTRDLLNVLDEVSKRGAGFRSLADIWADTTTAHGKLMLTVLGGLAEFERTLIAARTGEGRKRAKDRGVRFGRPRKMTAHQRQEAMRRLAAGETMADVARTYNVDATTIGRLAASSPFERAVVVQRGAVGHELPAPPPWGRVASAEPAIRPHGLRSCRSVGPMSSAHLRPCSHWE